MLEVTPGGTAPSGDEAKRILAFFLSSLQNPTLKRPPPVECMMSFNTLTPHYEEDVIYALSAGDTAKQLGLETSAKKVHFRGIGSDFGTTPCTCNTSRTPLDPIIRSRNNSFKFLAP